MLLITAASIMAVWLPGAIFIATVYIPASALQQGGPAVHRSLVIWRTVDRWPMAGRPMRLNFLFGTTFGTVYDAFTIAILCLAGACVIIALKVYVRLSATVGHGT